jgi:hypothetical protein
LLQPFAQGLLLIDWIRWWSRETEKPEYRKREEQYREDNPIALPHAWEFGSLSIVRK